MIKNIIITILSIFIIISSIAYHKLDKQCSIQSDRLINTFEEIEKYQVRANKAELALMKCKNEKKEIKIKPTVCTKYECGNPGTIARRMNNPLNIKRRTNGQKWEGELGFDKQGHVKFATVQHGIRAAAFVLRSYYRKHKIDNLTAIINRFCGGNKKYVAFLSKRMHLKPTQSFNVLNRMPELLRYMSQYESGKPLPEEYLVTLDVLENL